MPTSTCWLSGLAYCTRQLVLGMLIAAAAFQVNRQRASGQEHQATLRGNFEIGKSGRIIVLPIHFVDRKISCLLDTGAIAVLQRQFNSLIPGQRVAQVETQPWNPRSSLLSAVSRCWKVSLQVHPTIR